MIHITLILAAAENGVIGNKGGIPWHIPEDMRRFKALTMGKPIVMGRKTWESFPRRPLPGRTNIVITRDPAYRAGGAVIAASVDAALKVARNEQPEEIMIVGGAEIYRAALPAATRIQLTEIRKYIAGDTVFRFDRADWREVARTPHRTPDGLPYDYVTLERAP